MRVQHTLLIVAGVLLFGAGALLARVAVRPDPAPTVPVPSAAPVVEVPMRPALAAKATLPVGHFMQAGDFDWTDLPANMLRPEFIVRGTDDPGQFIGAVILHEVKAGETIKRNDLVSPRERGFLAAVLPPGMRSVSVAVDEVSGGAGLIFPGDRVDVIVTHTFNQDDSSIPEEQAVGETVLRNVRVLAVDQAMKGPTEAAPGGEHDANANTARAAARTVSLEVSPRDAGKLSVAVTLGRICLALRGLNRTGETETAEDSQPVWAGDVLTALKNRKAEPEPQLDVAAPAPLPSEGSRGVVVLRGGVSGQK